MRKRTWLACSVVLYLAVQAPAQQVFWSGTTGAFLDGNNWQGGLAPTFNDDAIIDNGGTAQHASGDATVFGLILASTSGSSGNFELSGGQILVEGPGEFGAVGTGSVTVSGGDLLVGSQSIFVGGRDDNTGSTGTGTMTVNDPSAYVESQDDFQLGRNGTGTLNLSAGQATGVFTVVGKFGSGLWNQSGGVYVATADLEIGDGGRPDQASISGPRSGEINLSGGVLQASEVFIGNRSGTGTVNVSGTGRLAATLRGSSSIVVGRGADWGAGQGGATELRVTGGDAILIANDTFDMNPASVASSSTLVTEITGPSHSTIKAGGNANLSNGTLRVELSGYTPQGGDSWVIVEAGADLSNEISAIDAYLSTEGYDPLTYEAQAVGGTLGGTTFAVEDLSAALPSGLSWDLSYTTNSVVLSVMGMSITCDFDGNGVCDIDDIDELIMGIAGGTMDLTFDLNGDGLVNLEDRDEWLALAGAENNASGNPYLVGDANLDGSVDVSDFNLWNSNKFTPADRWSTGDFNADGSADVSDFNAWNGNKFLSSDGVSAVPEPASCGWLLWLAGAVGMLARRR